MNLDAFRKVIREEVKKAIQEEMRDILLEAVKSASKPELIENQSDSKLLSRIPQQPPTRYKKL